MSQAIKDALADAETLQRIASQGMFDDVACHDTAWALIEAGSHGAWMKHPDNAYLTTRFVSAAAAFRAVPALRGDHE